MYRKLAIPGRPSRAGEGKPQTVPERQYPKAIHRIGRASQDAVVCNKGRPKTVGAMRRRP